MKKIKYIITILVISVLCGCGIKNNSQDIIKKFENRVNNSKSYSISGLMEISSNEETYTYDVSVDYKKPELYKVTLLNKINNHEQVILKNSDGVYVVTPALNKSFKFQSEWPNNSSQSYLLSSILNDIKSTKEIKVEKNKEFYIVTADVNYPNNKALTKEKIYFDKKNNLKEVQVLNKEDRVAIRMKFIKITYSSKFDADYFKLDSLIKDPVCDDDCNNTKETSVIDNIVYPLYLPQDTHLSTKDTVESNNGDRVIMTYTGAKPFMIIEESASVSKDMEVTSVYGDPLQLSMSIGALSSNSLEWQSNNMQYYITSTYLTSEEMMTIAESLNTASVAEITSK